MRHLAVGTWYYNSDGFSCGGHHTRGSIFSSIAQNHFSPQISQYQSPSNRSVYQEWVFVNQTILGRKMHEANHSLPLNAAAAFSVGETSEHRGGVTPGAGVCSD